VVHAERREDPLAEELVERLPRDAGDDEAEEHVARVAVGPARPRGEEALRLAPQQGEDLVVLDLALLRPGAAPAFSAADISSS